MIELNSISDMTSFKAFRKLPNGLDGFFLFKAGDRFNSSTSGKNCDKFASELMNCILSGAGKNKKSAMLISDLEIIKLIEIILKNSITETNDFREYIYIIYDIDTAVEMSLFDKNQALIEIGIYTEGKDFYYKDKLMFRRTTRKLTSGPAIYFEPYIEEESDDNKMEAF